MIDSSVDIVEDVTGIRLADLPPEDSRRQAQVESVLRAAPHRDILDMIDSFYDSRPPLVYRADETVPRLYKPQDFNYDHLTADPWFPDVQLKYIEPVVLYAHRIETTDPVHRAVQFAAFARDEPIWDWFPSIYPAHMILSALMEWKAYKPLIDARIITFSREPGLGKFVNLLQGLALKKSNGRGFRKLMIELMPGLEFRGFDGPDILINVLSAAEAQVVLNGTAGEAYMDLVGRKGEAPEKRSIRAAVFRRMLEERYTGWPRNRGNLAEFLAATSLTHADHWISSRKDLSLLNALLPSAAAFPEEGVLCTLSEMKFPAVKSLPPADLIALRNNSEALNGWRECLRQAFDELNRRTEAGASEADARNSAAVILSDTAADLIVRLQKDLKRFSTGAVRGLIIGAAAALPSILANRGHDLLVSGEGLTAGMLADLLMSRLEARGDAAAVRAVRRHLIVANDLLSV